MIGYNTLIQHNFYFFYGLFYFASGLGIMIQHRRKYPFRFAKDLWLMGIYALIHATSEWSYLFIPLQASNFSPQFMELLDLIPLVLESISFIFLFIFSFRLLFPRRFLRTLFIPIGIFLLWCAIIGILFVKEVIPAEMITYSQEFSHYLLLFPASILTALALYREGKEQGKRLPHKIITSLNELSGVFLFLAMLTLVMVDPGPFFPANVINSEVFYNVTHLPIELFKGLVGTLILIVTLKLLLQFNRETDRILAQAEEDAMRFSERERISQDLHDGVIQTLYATGMMLEATVRRLDAESPIREQLNFCIKSLNTSLLDLRHYITGLKGEGISRRLLKILLEDMFSEIQAKNRIQVEFSFQGDGCLQLTPNRQNHLYYVLKELLNNIEKHTTANTIRFNLVEETTDLVLSLWDNGQGNENPPREFWIKNEGQSCQGSGMGLRNLRERVAILRGEINYSYPSTGGSLVILRIPKEVFQ